MAKSVKHNPTYLKEEYEALVKYYKSENNASKHAYRCMEERYFKGSSKTLSRRREIGSIYQFVNGKIYTFEYTEPKYGDDRKKLPYYDARPIVLVINNWQSDNTRNNLLVGINLNLIPKKMRIAILDILLNKLNKQYKKRTMEEVVYHDDFYEFLKLVIGKLYSSGFEFAVRQYIFNLMSKPTYISPDDWKYVCLIDTKDLQNASLEEIYQKYWDNRKKLNLKTKTKKKK
jgi:hypothetical protein